ncbi:sugar phosphate isomerase/epimerase family protein [Lacrimispora sp. 210928-DFI.3.58]|uniref:sugar phosphate isomerase/epimerase family protein n=1 Tax=Lacrimispora sp. 210928-DFI.3.58 TaxID=2883214 RepID=UPI0015B72497|nr:TIM barrel protein [Lacrimispora sp. 210928-DFI.3.58]MCB7318605.1 sugar phosphate isomerase/epimerase [Lacrimispora sp. 210928-DFI.3.58]
MGTIKREDIANSNIHYRFYPFETFLEKQEELGVRKIDLFGATPHMWIDAYSASDAGEVRRQIEGRGMEVNSFTPEFSSMRYTLGAEGEGERKTWEYVKRFLEFAAGLGTGRIILTANGFLLDRDEKEQRRRLKDSLRHLGELGKPYGFQFLLLNSFSDGTSLIRTKADMEGFLAELSSESFLPAVDTASVYEAGECLEDWFSSFGESLSHVSFNNTKFDGARHYWGDGYLNPVEILEVLKHVGYGKSIGCSFYVRDYLKEPWLADERTGEIISWALGEVSV